LLTQQDELRNLGENMAVKQKNKLHPNSVLYFLKGSF
jgi:hypothetical protein